MPDGKRPPTIWGNVPWGQFGTAFGQIGRGIQRGAEAIPRVPPPSTWPTWNIAWGQRPPTAPIAQPRQATGLAGAPVPQLGAPAMFPIDPAQGRAVQMLRSQLVEDQTRQLQRDVPFAPPFTGDPFDMGAKEAYLIGLIRLREQSQILNQGFTQVAARPPGIGGILGGMGKLTGLEGLGQARRDLARGDLAQGGLPSAGGGALTAASMARSQREGSRAIAEQKDIIGELKAINPELFGSASGALKQMTAQAERWVDSPVSGKTNAAIQFSRSDEWQEAKRAVETERWFEFGDIYGMYLEYREGVQIAEVPMGFREWREKSPFVQAKLRGREEAEEKAKERTTLTAERRIRPPRFAVARQRGV